MPRLFARVSLWTLALGGLGVFSPADEPPWRDLLEGGSISTWVKRGGNAAFRLVDGEIIGTTAPGPHNTFLCTPREYADFELEYECRIDPRLNSGVQIRSQSAPGYQGGRVHGYQVELDPSERARTGGIYDEARRGWLDNLEKNDAAQQAFRGDDWNMIRVLARGEHIQTWVNGVAAADVHDPLTRSGFIGLQVHSTDVTEPLEVRWRKLRIRDLGGPWLAPPDGGEWVLGAGGDTAAWEHLDRPGSQVEWLWTDGALEVKPGTGNLRTRRAWGDCRLHVEFCVDENGQAGQANGNSGVYLQQRYEVQVLNSAGREPKDDECGAIYKVKAPDFALAQPAGQWQRYDIWFRAARWEAGKKVQNARITVYHNGTRTHDDVELPGSTGAGQPERPGDAPLMLQDHGNRVRFRNIWVAPLTVEARP